MPVSGLIINFSPDVHLRQATLDALRSHPAIQVGEATDHRLPIVVETTDSDESALMWEWLHSLPGVSLIDLAYLHFEDREENV